MQDALFQQAMLISGCLASVSSGLDFALKVEHNFGDFCSAVLSPASILMLTQVNLKLQSVNWALAAGLLLIFSQCSVYEHANLSDFP